MPELSDHHLAHIESQIKRTLHLWMTNIILNKNKKEGEAVVRFKPKQIQAIIASCEGRDVLAVLATGYGKSLIFEAIPIFLTLTRGTTIKTLIMSPLNVIIEQQLAKLGSAACRVDDAVLDLDCSNDSINSISSDEFGDKELADANSNPAAPTPHAEPNSAFKFIVGHPEEFLTKASMEAMRKSSWAKDIMKIVVDECHTVAQWSKDFRTDFGEIQQLKSIFPSASLLALTATASSKMQAEIKHILNMPSATVISTSVDRVNTKYTVKKRDSNYLGTETSYTGVFMPYVQQLKSQGPLFPKTVVYTTLQWSGFGNELGVRQLTSNVNSDGVPEIAQYHAPLSATAKQKVAEKMRAKDSQLRLLIATEAYGMGVDTQDIRRVIHAGPPCTLETYMQTTGRGGRDGLPCDAILYYNNEDIGKVIVEQDMKTFCRLTTPDCRRKYICAYFGTEQSFSGLGHDCCDLCESVCHCQRCTDASAPVQEHPDVVKVHNKNVERAIYDYLKQLFYLLNAVSKSAIDTQLATGLTENLAKDVATNYEHLMTIESLGLMYVHLESEPVQQILEAIESCHRDFE